MDTKPICPSCQKPLPPDVPLGLCPECLMKSGFPTGTEPGLAGPEGSGFVPPPLEQLAKLFPQLEIIEFIGKGGMGAVYKARQPALDRFVALKILPPGASRDPGFAERFNREARALARLTHPNIVAVHDFGQAGGLHYLTMEFVDGANLREIEQAGRLAPEQALAIVPQICEALQYAHNESVVHRDIKPENLLLDKRGRVKITDFGIAKIMASSQTLPETLTRPSDTLSHRMGEGRGEGKPALTTAGHIIGTPHYMAPEQIEKPQSVDHRADIYSLGVVFYEMLTGELPIGKFQPPSRLGGMQVDVRLDEVVLRALEKEPERRYQQASQVKTAVETIAADAGEPNSDASRAGVQSPKSRIEQSLLTPLATQKNRWEATIVVLGIFSFLLLLSVVMESSRPSRVPVIVLCIVGLGICALSLAGVWPVASHWFPEPNFSSRNLRRRQESASLGSAQEPRFSRTAIAGACWAPLFFVALLLWYWAEGPSRPGLRIAFLGFPILALGLTAPFGATILGWIAVSQIRHSAGRLYGLGLAVFDGLLFPLLALDAAIVIALSNVLGGSLATSMESSAEKKLFAALLVAFIAAACLIPTALIVRAVWRLVSSKGIDTAAIGVASQPQPARSAARTWFFGSSAVFLIAVMLFGLLVVGSFVLAIALPALHRAKSGTATEQPVKYADAGPAIEHVASFGPEREVLLNVLGSDQPNRFLNLDIGNLPEPPRQYREWSMLRKHRWLRENGVDLMIMGGGLGPWRLATPVDSELQLFKVPGRYWEQAIMPSRDDFVAEKAGRIQFGDEGIELLLTSVPGVRMNPNDTVAFETANGSRGLLRMEQHTENPPGIIKVRYKLAYKPPAGAEPSAGNRTIESLSPADQARAVALFNDIEDFGHEFSAAFSGTNLVAARTGTRRLLNLLTNFNAEVRGTEYEFPSAIQEDIAKVDQALADGDWERARRLGAGNDEYRARFRQIAVKMAELARQWRAGAAEQDFTQLLNNASARPSATAQDAAGRLRGVESSNPFIIEPGVSVGKIHQGMTLRQVIAEYGQPDAMTNGALEYLRLGLTVIPNQEGLVRMVVCGDADRKDGQLTEAFKGRTSRGIGIGSSRADIIKAYGEPTSSKYKDGQDILAYTSFHTTFGLRDGKVTGIATDFRPEDDGADDK